VVDRALTVSMSEPRGPVYLSLPREVLAAEIESFTYASPSRQNASAAPAPNPNALDEAAALLAGAENPMIITNWGGRNPGVMAALGELAGHYAIPVVQYRNRFTSLATDHPMHMGFEPGELLAEADVVLVLDTAVPWLPARHTPRDDVKVIQMAPDPLYGYVPIRGFPSHIGLTCASDVGLRMLDEAMAEPAKKNQVRIDTRRTAITEKNAAMRAKWQEVLARSTDMSPMHPAFVSHCINEIKDVDTIVVKESPLLSSISTPPGRPP
jgi:acetolactate synthase-1/2/3 large subunit